MSVRRLLAVAVGLGLLAPLAACQPQEPEPAKTASAVQWLATRQQPDGGFEPGPPGLPATPDAILALAVNTPFSRCSTPLECVASYVSPGGKTALDSVDDLIDDAPVPSVAASVEAARVAALVAGPLQLDPTRFDPGNDTVHGVDLFARIDQYAQPDGTLAFGDRFDGVLYAVIAEAQADRPVATGLLGQVGAAQRSDGSWAVTGSSAAGQPGDVATTALALLALSVDGIQLDDPGVRAGVAYLASRQGTDGSFGGDVDATSASAVALSALHIDVTNDLWRSEAGHPVVGGADYTSPYVFLDARQAGDGHIVGSSDGSSPATGTTSRAVQALGYQWFLQRDLQAFSRTLTSLTTDGAYRSGFGLDNASIGGARTRAAMAGVLSQPSLQTVVDHLYLQVFGRYADASGRATFADQLTRIDRPAVLLSLVSSAEFTNAHGPGADAYVDGLYPAILGRPADPGGRAAWVRAIANGTPRAEVAREIIASVEYRTRSVTGAYQLLLGRNPTDNERSAGLLTLATDRIETVLGSVGGSQEFYDRSTGFRR